LEVEDEVGGWRLKMRLEVKKVGRWRLEVYFEIT
jgi:hypothetical protein